MKNLKFLNGRLLLAAACLSVIMAMSFQKLQNENASSVHYYVSEDMNEGDFRNTANWSTVNEDGISCGSVQVRPCKITVPTGSTLSAVLGSKNNSQVLGISEGYKPNP